MEVLILSKTHYGKMFCVGGIVIRSNQYVRLINPDGWYQPADTEFEVGDVWDLTFTSANNIRPPHVEDVILFEKRYIRSIQNITDFLRKSNVPIWEGNLSRLFDGKLNWSPGGSAYINEKNGLPNNSVGFWVSDKPLIRQIVKRGNPDGSETESVRYIYKHTVSNLFTFNRSFPYKGCDMPVEIIPAGIMLRVSLAKWWDTNGATEERCALQLSGWYGLEAESDEDEADDLPF